MAYRIHRACYFCLKVSLGTVLWCRGSYGTDFEIPYTIYYILHTIYQILSIIYSIVWY